MKILSFDIGVKNLAYCILCKETTSIVDWGIINISCDDVCEHINSKGNKCDKSATYRIYGDNKERKICTSHSKLKQYNSEKNIKCKKIKSKNGMHNLGKQMVTELDKHMNFLDCDTVIVENQPSLKNPTMKSVQMMVYTYFLIKSNPTNLEMINARNKLKVYKGPKLINECPYQDIQKNRYKRNKWFAIEYCKNMIQTEKKEFIELYKTSKKRDDLSDCYLQGIYWIQK